MGSPWRVATVLLAGAMLVVLPAAAFAQEEGDDTARIAVPSERLGEDSPGEFHEAVTVYADGVECGSFSLVDQADRNADGDAEFVIGGEDQHELCSTEDARITFLDADDRRIHQEFRFDPGSTFTFAGLGPAPPGEPVRVRVPWRLIRQRAAMAPNATGTIGQALEYLDVYAQSEFCGRLPLNEDAVDESTSGRLDEHGDAWLGFGPDAPQPCKTSGTPLRFVAGGVQEGKKLQQTLAVRRPQAAVLLSMAFEDADAPGPPEVGTGLTTGDGTPSGAVAIAVAGIPGAVVAVFAWRRLRP